MIRTASLVGASILAAIAGQARASQTIHACVNNTNGQVRVVAAGEACRIHERSLDWNSGTTGPAQHALTSDHAVLADRALVADSLSSEFHGEALAEGCRLEGGLDCSTCLSGTCGIEASGYPANSWMWVATVEPLPAGRLDVSIVDGLPGLFCESGDRSRLVTLTLFGQHQPLTQGPSPDAARLYTIDASVSATGGPAQVHYFVNPAIVNVRADGPLRPGQPIHLFLRGNPSAAGCVLLERRVAFEFTSEPLRRNYDPQR